MVIYLPDFIKKAMNILEANGHECYLVGGCVRDAAMGEEPSDYDMATDAQPDEVKKCFAGFHVIETGLKHGTVTVIIDGEKTEITTFRTDGEYEDNRHPSSVCFTRDLKSDLARRDFTINAMAYNPRTGTVDFFGGMEQLQSRTLKCVGDADTRFCEDGLRILRALRFASVLGFGLEEKTAESVLKNKTLLHNIAAERISDEFTKLICGKAAVEIIRSYREVIAEFIPEIRASFDFKQNNIYHVYDVFEHTLRALSYTGKNKYLRLAVLLHDIGKPCCYSEEEGRGHFYGHAKVSAEMTETILRRLKYDNHTVETVSKLVREHDRQFDESQPSLKRFLATRDMEYVSLLMQLKRADVMGQGTERYDRIEQINEIERLLQEIQAKNECVSIKQLKINGNDLKINGIPQSPLMGKILKRLTDGVVEGVIPNEREALINEAMKISEEAEFQTK